MKKIKNRKLKLPIFITIVVALVFALIFYWQKPATVQHVSKDLKISLSYPNGWFIDDEDFSILLASYKTYIGQNSRPNPQQLKIFIDRFSNCFPSIEEDLRYPACGQREDGQANEIVFKEIKDKSGGTYYKYVTRTPEDKELVYYFLEKGDKILQISKEPDPSQYEKEFEEIVNSIRFR